MIVSLIRKSRRIHEVPLGNQLLEKIDNLAGNKPLFPILYSQSERKLKDNLAKPRKFLQSIDDRAVLLTHSSSETTKIYTHPNLNLAFEYINKMSDFN